MPVDDHFRPSEMAGKIVLISRSAHPPAVRNKEFLGDRDIPIKPGIPNCRQVAEHMEQDVDDRVPKPRAALAKTLSSSAKVAGGSILTP
jgi:hypothetical protein